MPAVYSSLVAERLEKAQEESNFHPSADFTKLLDVDAAEEIISIISIVVNPDDQRLLIVNPSIDLKHFVTINIQGGIKNREYSIRIHVSTSQNRDPVLVCPLLII